MHLRIESGEHAANYLEIRTREKLSEIQLRIRQLLEQCEQIGKEQDYQRVSPCPCYFTLSFLRILILAKPLILIIYYYFEEDFFLIPDSNRTIFLKTFLL